MSYGMWQYVVGRVFFWRFEGITIFRNVWDYTTIDTVSHARILEVFNSSAVRTLNLEILVLVPSKLFSNWYMDIILKLENRIFMCEVYGSYPTWGLEAGFLKKLVKQDLSYAQERSCAIWLVNTLMPVVSPCSTRYNIRYFHVMPTWCISMISMDHRKKNSYFPLQNKRDVFYNQERGCSLFTAR